MSHENLNTNGLSRGTWISACEFHPHSDQEVLDEVLRRISLYEHPVVLFDLDATLYEVSHRSNRILQEWAASDHGASYPELKDELLDLKISSMHYSIRETLHALWNQSNTKSFSLQQFNEALKSATAFWMNRFFTNDYLRYDQPYPGALEFVKSVLKAGARIVYLTGRDEPNMGVGTRANFERDGLPWNLPGVELWMKPAFEMDDLEFKVGSMRGIPAQGQLVASFENEPPNVVALSEIFPEAMHIFVDTLCSERSALPKKGLYRIRGFCS